MRSSTPPASADAGITVIIPVYRPNLTALGQLLDRLMAQSLPPRRILLVQTLEEGADGKESSEGQGGDLFRLTAAYPASELIQIPREAFDHAGTRDMAASRCETPILVFMTMDALPADRHVLAHLAKALADPAVACAYARQLPRKEADLLERMTRDFNYPSESRLKRQEDIKQLGIKAFFCSNVCAAYRRETYFKLGGFKQPAIFNEDMVFAAAALREGYGVYYCARARVFHSHHYTGLQQFHRNFDLGVSQAQHPEVFDQKGAGAAGEGLRMIRQQVRALWHEKRPLQIIRLLWLSGWKFMGFSLGRHYRLLPGRLVLRFTSNPYYWKHVNQ